MTSNIRFDAEALAFIREEIEERYDLFDLINLLNWKLADLYPYLEDPLLDRLDERELTEPLAEFYGVDDDGCGDEED